MSEVNRNNFTPIVPVYDAYPIPATMEPWNANKEHPPEELFRSGDRVIGQMLRAAVDRSAPDQLHTRMENGITFVTPQGHQITRSSGERKTRGNPEVSRIIADQLQFAGLGNGETGFDRIWVVASSAEYRSEGTYEREIELATWSVRFYRPGMNQPAAGIHRKVEGLVRSYVEINEGNTLHPYGWPHGQDLYSHSHEMRYIEALDGDHPEILREFEAAIAEAQYSMFQPMQPALTNRDIVALRGLSATTRNSDPHTRHVGRIARLSDRIIAIVRK